MLKHVKDLHEHVINSVSLKTRGREWQDIKKRVTNQVVLRVVSCIQIASKLTSHYKVSTIQSKLDRHFLAWKLLYN